MVVVYGVGSSWSGADYTALDAETWYVIPRRRIQVFVAGAWFSYVCLPVFQFLLLRWYFRLFIWARLLWQVSRIGSP